MSSLDGTCQLCDSSLSLSPSQRTAPLGASRLACPVGPPCCPRVCLPHVPLCLIAFSSSPIALPFLPWASFVSLHSLFYLSPSVGLRAVWLAVCTTAVTQAVARSVRAKALRVSALKGGADVAEDPKGNAPPPHAGRWQSFRHAKDASTLLHVDVPGADRSEAAISAATHAITRTQATQAKLKCARQVKLAM